MVLAVQAKTAFIKGLIPVSMLDWDGNLATVIFAGGCNFRCPFCHNADLVKDTSLKTVNWREIEEHLTSKKDWLDGVVITGGEPTIHKDLPDLARLIKDMGMSVKLDTNGALPGALSGLIEEKVVDFVAMDIKSSFQKYELATKTEIKLEDIKASISLIREAGVDYEFRTTVVPGIADEEDVLEIAEFISGSAAFYLQQFKPEDVLEPQALISQKNANGEMVYKGELKGVRPYSTDELFSLAGKCSKFVKTKVRNI